MAQLAYPLKFNCTKEVFQVRIPWYNEKQKENG